MRQGKTCLYMVAASCQLSSSLAENDIIIVLCTELSLQLGRVTAVWALNAHSRGNLQKT